MSISVGGIDLAGSIVDAQYRIAVLEKIVEHLINRVAPGALTPADIKRYQDEALADLQKKYPGAGIKRT